MNNVQQNNRDGLVGIYLDYTAHQLNQLLKTQVDMIARNADHMSEDNIATMLLAQEHMAAAIVKINSLKPQYPINIAPEHNTETCEHCAHTHTSTGKYSPDCTADNVRRCPGCGEFDTFSGKYCSDCIGNIKACSGPNPSY